MQKFLLEYRRKEKDNAADWRVYSDKKGNQVSTEPLSILYVSGVQYIFWGVKKRDTTSFEWLFSFNANFPSIHSFIHSFSLAGCL